MQGLLTVQHVYIQLITVIMPHVYHFYTLKHLLILQKENITNTRTALASVRSCNIWVGVIIIIIVVIDLRGKQSQILLCRLRTISIIS